MRIIVVLSLYFLVFQLNGQQFPSQRWHRGQVLLANGELLNGAIQYNLETEIIQLRRGGKVQAYNANQITNFKIVSTATEGMRVFYALPFRNQTGYVRPQFFEIITEGSVTLMAREYIGTDTRMYDANPSMRRFRSDPFYNGFGPRAFSTRYLAFRLYIVNLKGKVTELGSSKKEVVYAFDGKHKELKQFIKQEKLSMDSIKDIALLVAHYNSLLDT